MARTKASVGAKVSSGKSSKARCTVVAVPSTSNGGASARSSQAKSSGGGNPVCPRETPKWQRPITNFFNGKPDGGPSRDGDGEDGEGSQAEQQPKPRASKRNVIESDDEEEVDGPVNKELDETIELEPLSGESSHKLEEYYTTGPKGKGIGKKTQNKENIDENNVRRSSVKRDLEEHDSGTDEQVSKRVKVVDS